MGNLQEESKRFEIVKLVMDHYPVRAVSEVIEMADMLLDWIESPDEVQD